MWWWLWLAWWIFPMTIGLVPLSLMQFACKTALRENVPIIYIYRCTSCPFQQQEQDLQNLHKCIMSNATSIVRSIELYELEPLRETKTMNIFLIYGGGIPLVRRILDMLNHEQQEKHSHKYIFIWPMANLTDMHYLFTGCWSKQVINALALTQGPKLYDYKPFTETGILQVQLLNESSILFDDKLKNLYGYQLRYSMFSDPLRSRPLGPNVTVNGFEAIDGSAARLIAMQLNATALYIIPTDNDTYGQCLPNGTITGVVRDLKSGYTHFGPNRRYVLDCIWPHVEKLYPYTRRIIYLVVPAADIRPEYLIFIRAFRNSVWSLLFGNFLLVFTLFHTFQRLLQRIRPQDMHQFRWFEIFEMFAKTHLGEPVAKFTQISSLRAFLISWILFSYVLTSFYFAKLESSFVQPTYEEQVDVIEDLPKLHVKVHAINNMFTAIKTVLTERQYSIISAWKQEHSLYWTSHYYELNVIDKERRPAFIMRDEIAKDFVVITYNHEADRPRYHVVKEYLRTMPCTYILPKGSAFLYKFQWFIITFHEHGLFEYWRRMDVMARRRRSLQDDDQYSYRGSDDSIEEPSADDDFAGDDTENWHQKQVVLSLEILQGAFYMWLVGILLSTLGFVIENAYFSYRRSKKLCEE